eukprot:TRINITY_DN1814_c0_g1_i1.p1 TRINITY_DN1814_c0_g1~~TRINITY_DN1814_c0_g1_i1.p1  ORF type:complete len:221 (-),score=56.48 TRINITY_DN1814_c0_g1_i1:65-727(-)
MLRTTEELVRRFQAYTGFTCSDEITLIFPLDPSLTQEELENREILHGGKIQKIVSLTAGYASTLFSRYILEENFDDNENLAEFVQSSLPHFDSRVHNVVENYELVNNLMWRARFDYRRNSISGLAQAHFSSRELHGKNTKQQIEMLEEINISWDECPDWYKYGTYVKKEYYIKSTEVKGEMIDAIRSRIVSKSFEIENTFSKEMEDWVVQKTWNSPPQLN